MELILPLTACHSIFYFLYYFVLCFLAKKILSFTESDIIYCRHEHLRGVFRVVAAASRHHSTSSIINTAYWSVFVGILRTVSRSSDGQNLTKS